MIPYVNPPRPRPIAAEHAYIAQSPAGTYLRELEEAQRAHLRQRAVFADLEALRAEAKQDDWAGREGKAIQPESYLLARALLESLIPSFETPELNVDRDGAVVLDWAWDREHMLSLTAEPDGRLIYAFRAGSSSGSRTERFQGVIPPALAADLAEVTQTCR